MELVEAGPALKLTSRERIQVGWGILIKWPLHEESDHELEDGMGFRCSYKPCWSGPFLGQFTEMMTSALFEGDRLRVAFAGKSGVSDVIPPC